MGLTRTKGKAPKDLKKTFCLIFSFWEEKGHRVDWLVTEHLSAQGRPDSRGGLIVYGVQTKLELLLLRHLTR
jgi:hypothetical protein